MKLALVLALALLVAPGLAAHPAAAGCDDNPCDPTPQDFPCFANVKATAGCVVQIVKDQLP